MTTAEVLRARDQGKTIPDRDGRTPSPPIVPPSPTGTGGDPGPQGDPLEILAGTAARHLAAAYRDPRGTGTFRGIRLWTAAGTRYPYALAVTDGLDHAYAYRDEIGDRAALALAEQNEWRDRR